MKTLGKILAMMLCLVMFAACGPTARDAADVAQKIEKGEKLDENDYGVMIDYCVDYAKKAQEFQDEINKTVNPNSKEAVKGTEGLENLLSEYQYSGLFFEKLGESSESEVGRSNVKKVNEYASLDYFIAPEWAASPLPDKDVVGVLEETPDSDSSAVIATGIGEVVADSVRK